MPQTPVTTVILFSALLIIMSMISAYSTMLVSNVKKEGIREALSAVAEAVAAQIAQAESLATSGSNVTIRLSAPKLLGKDAYLIYFINASSANDYLGYVDIAPNRSAIVLKLGNVWAGMSLPPNTFISSDKVLLISTANIYVTISVSRAGIYVVNVATR